jgi:hypothetical protein
MTRLIVLSLVLVLSFAAFLARGLPQTARLERAWDALRQRERELEATRAEVDLPGADEYQALVARHARAQAQLDQRWAILTEGPPRAPGARAQTALLEHYRRRGLAPTRPRSRRPCCATRRPRPRPRRSIVAIVQALPDARGLDVEELALRDGGRPRALPDDVGLEEVEAQLVLTGALADVLAALERFAPERGEGLAGGHRAARPRCGASSPSAGERRARARHAARAAVGDAGRVSSRRRTRRRERRAPTRRRGRVDRGGPIAYRFRPLRSLYITACTETT